MSIDSTPSSDALTPDRSTSKLDHPSDPSLTPPNSPNPLMSGTFAPDGWFEFVTRIQPHHTDYAGIVWHGTYLTWLETARVEYLRSRGIGYEDLVKEGLDLPVVDLQIRYHQAIRLGMAIRVRARLQPQSGVRLTWDYAITSLDRQTVHATATVHLIALQRPEIPQSAMMPGQAASGKILRRLPTILKEALQGF